MRKAVALLFLFALPAFGYTPPGCRCYNEDGLCDGNGIHAGAGGDPLSTVDAPWGIVVAHELGRTYYGGAGGRCSEDYDLTYCYGTNGDKEQYFVMDVGISVGDNNPISDRQGVQPCPGQSQADTFDNTDIFYYVRVVEMQVMLENSGTGDVTVTVSGAGDSAWGVLQGGQFETSILLSGGETEYMTLYLYGSLFGTSGFGGCVRGTASDVPPPGDNDYVYAGGLQFKIEDSTSDDDDYCVDNCDANIRVTFVDGVPSRYVCVSDTGICGQQIGADCAGTPTPTFTASNTPGGGLPVTPTPTFTRTPTSTWTPSPTRTPTPTVNPSHTPTPTFTASNTFTPSPTPTPGWEVIPTIAATPGANTYSLCAFGYSARDENDSVNNTGGRIGYNAGIEGGLFLAFKVPTDAPIAADNVVIKTVELELGATRGSLTTAQTLDLQLKAQNNFFPGNWYLLEDMQLSPLLDVETYVAPGNDLTSDVTTYNVLTQFPIAGWAYTGRERFFYFAVRSGLAASGDTTEKNISAPWFVSFCADGEFTILNRGARLIFTYDTNGTIPTPAPTSTPTNTPAVNAENVFFAMPVPTYGILGSDASTPSPPYVGFAPEADFATYYNEMFTYSTSIKLDYGDENDALDYWFTGEGSVYDRVVLTVDFQRNPGSEAGSLPIMLVASEGDPRSSFNALQNAQVLSRTTLEDVDGVIRKTFDATGAFPDILTAADLNDWVYLTIMPDTRGFNTMQSFRVANIDYDLYFSDPEPTATRTPTGTSTPTFTASNTFTPTNTSPPTNTPTFTFTPSPTRTNTPGPSPTPTFTPSFTRTPTPTQTFTPSNTPTPTETLTPSNTPIYARIMGASNQGLQPILMDMPLQATSVYVTDAVFPPLADFSILDGRVRMPGNLPEGGFGDDGMAVTSDDEAVMEINDSGSAEYFRANFNPPIESEIDFSGDSSIRFEMNEIDFGGVGAANPTSHDSALTFYNGLAVDGRVEWNNTENRAYFGPAYVDVDSGPVFPGRATLGSSAAQLIFFTPPLLDMPDITAGAFELSVNSPSVVGPEYIHLTSAATREVGVPAPVQSNGSRVNKIRIHVRMDSASHTASCEVKRMDYTTGTVSTVASFSGVARGSMTLIGGTNYYHELTVNHTIGSEKIWAYVSLYRADANTLRWYGTHWFYDEVKK